VEDPDLPLVQALQAGHDAALDELMARHKDALSAFIYRYVLNETDAAELTQETFVRAYFNICSFRPSAKFVTWLYTIATNLCRDHARSRHGKEARRTSFLSAEETPEISSGTALPDEEAIAHEQTAAVAAAIANLPHDLKTALILTALEGLSHIEAGLRLGISPKAVETRVHRARQRLEKALHWKPPSP